MMRTEQAFQLSILDSIAGNAALLEQYRHAFLQYKEAVKRLDETQREMEQLQRNEDYIRFQLDQLQAMQLQPDEDVLLEAQQSRLSNITELKEDLWTVESELNSEENSVLERLAQVAQRLEDAEKNLTDVEGMSGRVRTAIIDLKDIAQSTAAIVDTLNDDPAELARIDERLNNIYSLERKHNAQDVNQLIEIQQSYERQLSEIEHNDDIIQELKALVSTTRAAAMDIASRLSSQRHDAAMRFDLLDFGPEPDHRQPD